MLRFSLGLSNLFFFFLYCKLKKKINICVFVLPTACPEHKWGPNCSNSCPCLNGAKCDPVNGSCTCTAGWKGLHCDYPCPKNYYGQSCSLKCQVIILYENTPLSTRLFFNPECHLVYIFSHLLIVFSISFLFVFLVQESSLLRSCFRSMRLSTRMEWTTVIFENFLFFIFEINLYQKLML